MLAIHGTSYSVCSLFTESQHNTARHRKNIHALHKLFLSLSDASQQQEFLLALVHCLNVVLSVKRNEELASRIIRLIVGFVVYISEKDGEAATGPTNTTRLIENLMLYVLEHVDAKEKHVRARLGQVLVACVNALNELGDGVWQVFKAKMAERLFDKEAAVRVQAVHAMARVQTLYIGSMEVIDIFMDLLQQDPSVDVRKAVLIQIDINSKSLPAILERRRDVDPSVRKLFYTAKMSEIDIHALTIDQRHDILQTGLNDRDAAVKQACIDMVFANWIKRTNNNLVEFLSCLDVMNSLSVAENMLRCFFSVVPNMFASFSDQYMGNLTAETALTLRVFCQFTKEKEGLAAVQEIIPELSQISLFIKRTYEALLAVPPDGAERAETEFILQELVDFALLADFSDEVGRRALVDVALELLCNLELSDISFQKVLKLMLLVAPTIDEYLALTGSLISDFRDVYSGLVESRDQLDRSFESLSIEHDSHEMSPDVQIMAQLRCLDLVHEALLFSDVNFQRYPQFLELLNAIIIPAVNSAFVAVQASGLACLGLCCACGKSLSIEYLSLFIAFLTLDQEETKLIALQILFDIICLYGALSKISMALYDSNPAIQTLAAEGFAKLFLHQIVFDRDVIEGLFCLYFHPSSKENTRLRQCLAYFFPAFSFFSFSNQSLVSSAFIPVLKTWQKQVRHIPYSLPMQKVADQMLYFIDPSNLREPSQSSQILGELAEALCWEALSNPDESKFYITQLSHIRLTSCIPIQLVKRLLYLTATLLKVQTDKTLLNSLKKYVAMLVELDDAGETLNIEDISQIKERLNTILPAQVPFPPSTAAMTRPKTKTKAASKSIAALSANLVDDIDDIIN